MQVDQQTDKVLLIYLGLQFALLFQEERELRLHEIPEIY
jgi:hypothetical protein